MSLESSLLPIFPPQSCPPIPPFTHPVQFSPFLILFTSAFYLPSLHIFPLWPFTSVLTSVGILNIWRFKDTIHKWEKTFKVCYPGHILTSLGIIVSSPIHHQVTCEFHNYLLLNTWVILHCVKYHTLSIRSSVHFLAIVNNTSMNMDVRVSL